MKNNLKKIDSFLSKKILGHSIGFYPELKGLKGNIKLYLFGNRDYLKKGVIKSHYEMNNEIYDFFINALENPKNKYESNNIELKLAVSENYKIGYDCFSSNDIFFSLTSHLESLLNLKLKLLKIDLWRNYNISESDSKLISADWHFDRRPTNWIRVFILLQNVDISHGPFTYLDKISTKNYVKYNGFRRDNKLNSSLIDSSEQINQFTGSKFDLSIVNTQKCLHRAGFVEKDKKRDLIQFIYKY